MTKHVILLLSLAFTMTAEGAGLVAEHVQRVEELVARHAGANAVWIVGELPNQTDFDYFGEKVISQEWELGDAAIKVPGYDVRILPVSGIAQLFIYDLLLRAAQDSTDAGYPQLAARSENTSVTSPSH